MGDLTNRDKCHILNWTQIKDSHTITNLAISFTENILQLQT